MRAILEQVQSLTGNVEQINWILSATAQSFAAVFALYFTVLIFSTQAASRYNPQAFRDIFNRWQTFVLLALFGSAIITPLIFLKNPSSFKAWIGIIIGISSLIFLVVDLFTDLYRKLIPSQYIHSLLKKAKRRKQNIEEIIENLGDMATSYYSTNPPIFREAIDTIVTVVSKHGGLSKAWQTLDRLARQTIDHPTAPVKLVDTLRLLYKLTEEPEYQSLIIFSMQEIEELCDQRKLRLISAACLEVIHLAFTKKDTTKEYTDYLNDLYQWQVTRIINKHEKQNWLDLLENDTKIIGIVMFELLKRDSNKGIQSINTFKGLMHLAIRDGNRQAMRASWKQLIATLEYSVSVNHKSLEEIIRLVDSYVNSNSALISTLKEHIKELFKIVSDGIKKIGLLKFKPLIFKFRKLLSQNIQWEVRIIIARFIIQNLKVVIQKDLSSLNFNEFMSFWPHLLNFNTYAVRQEPTACINFTKLLVELIKPLDSLGNTDQYKMEGISQMISHFIDVWKINQSTNQDSKIDELVYIYFWIFLVLLTRHHYGNIEHQRGNIITTLQSYPTLIPSFLDSNKRAKREIKKYSITVDDYDLTTDWVKQRFPEFNKR